MNKYKSIDFMDFYFGDKKLSDFGFYVGGVEGYRQYSVLPAREYVTGKPIGSDITNVYSSSLQPRPFVVPIVKENIEDGDVRLIASWLNSPESRKFQFIGDDVYINATLDSVDFVMEALGNDGGAIELKFIAHDPFYYSTVDKKVTVVKTAQTISVNVDNTGYETAYPIIKIGLSKCQGFEIECSNGDCFNTIGDMSLQSGVIIDMASRRMTSLSGVNLFKHTAGVGSDWIEFDTGNSTLDFTGVFNSGGGFTNITVEWAERYL